ncbi:MAG: hypothetical protein KDI63_12945 [Gammaproteobacteria bacterium]|nr:hypothetical protein [Gammaproteobacteria bacterium]
MDDPTRSETSLRQKLPGLILGAFALLFFSVIAVLIWKSGPAAVTDVATWFDPVFFQYNVFLVGFSVLLIPAVTFVYVFQLKGAKLERLHNELPRDQWQASEGAIRGALKYQFSFHAFFGSMTVLMLVVIFGASIILLLKPVPIRTELISGVDYSQGANLLLMGPFIELGTKDPEFFRHAVISLTAFQFGFLGAYVYFIGRLARDYFTLDLTNHTYIAATIRIATASLLSLVVSFAFSHLRPDDDNVRALLPVISFFFGYFPEQALEWLKRMSMRFLDLAGEGYRETLLPALPGMNYYHCTRLAREGYDNIENLSNARPLDLALRTGFGYLQLRQWIGQAWLMVHLGVDDYYSFVAATGITDPDEMLLFAQLDQGSQVDTPYYHQCAPELHQKIQNLSGLLPGWIAHRDTYFQETN